MTKSKEKARARAAANAERERARPVRATEKAVRAEKAKARAEKARAEAKVKRPAKVAKAQREPTVPPLLLRCNRLRLLLQVLHPALQVLRFKLLSRPSKKSLPGKGGRARESALLLKAAKAKVRLPLVVKVERARVVLEVKERVKEKVKPEARAKEEKEQTVLRHLHLLRLQPLLPPPHQRLFSLLRNRLEKERAGSVVSKFLSLWIASAVPHA